ncbi:MAG: hypothetical protein IRZ07_03400 [Microbispora sp.]|nr:hypothetical protein [Microbispora sp.]
MNDYVISLIRTWVPVGVGLVITWLARELGVVLDDDTTATAATVAVAVVTAVYYAAARALESRWPALGVLLGAAKTPAYPARAGEVRR